MVFLPFPVRQVSDLSGQPVPEGAERQLAFVRKVRLAMRKYAQGLKEMEVQ